MSPIVGALIGAGITAITGLIVHMHMTIKGMMRCMDEDLARFSSAMQRAAHDLAEYQARDQQTLTELIEERRRSRTSWGRTPKVEGDGWN